MVALLQGMRKHLQMPTSLKVPVCHVPCGSGNGVAATLGLWNEATAVHAIVKGHVRALDAATVQRSSETQPLLAVLSVQYALLTDLDVGTEHLRNFLGGERFTYGAVREILKWKKHRARVAYCTNAAHTVGSSQGMGGCALKVTGCTIPPRAGGSLAGQTVPLPPVCPLPWHFAVHVASSASLM